MAVAHAAMAGDGKRGSHQQSDRCLHNLVSVVVMHDDVGVGVLSMSTLELALKVAASVPRTALRGDVVAKRGARGMSRGNHLQRLEQRLRRGQAARAGLGALRGNAPARRGWTTS